MVEGAADDNDDEGRWSRWMLSAQSGDEAAYRLLLAELGRASEQFLRGRFGEQPFNEDCVQDTLLAVHQARHTYDGRRPFRAWFYAILRHKAVDHLRRRDRRQRERDAQLRESAVHGQFSGDDGLEEALAPGRLMAALSPQHRDALALTKIAGLSTAEAAARLDISESALKVRVHRAIQRLRGLLESEST
jgi:RNA polymerase sigma-70 factor (ECF subfamily)